MDKGIREAKGRRCCLGGRIESFLYRASCCINSVPQTPETTFAFSSYLFLLLIIESHVKVEDDIECRPFSLSHAYWLCRLEADPCSLCAACCAAARLLSSDFWRGRAPSPGARPPPPPPPTQLLRVSRPPVSRRVAENNSFSTIS